MPVFTRGCPMRDWVEDLGENLLYERQVRVEKRKEVRLEDWRFAEEREEAKRRRQLYQEKLSS